MDEAERLKALRELDTLDASGEKEFDDLVRLASAACGTPVGLISLVDEDRQWFKATVGLDDSDTPINLSFCFQAIKQRGLLIVEDVMRDPRFTADPPLMETPRFRFYAAVPLLAPGGSAIGALCVVDTEPRRLTQTQREALIILAAQVESRMGSRVRHKSLRNALAVNERLVSTLTTTNDLFLSFMACGPFASYIKEADGSMVFYNRYLAEASGVTEQQWIGLKDDEIWPGEMAAKFRSDDIEVLAGKTPREHEDVSPRADGSYVIWRSIKFPYVTESGKTMLAGISMDITEQVMREAELEDALRAKR